MHQSLTEDRINAWLRLRYGECTGLQACVSPLNGWPSYGNPDHGYLAAMTAEEIRQALVWTIDPREARIPTPR